MPVSFETLRRLVSHHAYQITLEEFTNSNRQYWKIVPVSEIPTSGIPGMGIVIEIISETGITI
jgi:hypothetical protein